MTPRALGTAITRGSGTRGRGCRRRVWVWVGVKRLPPPPHLTPKLKPPPPKKKHIKRKGKPQNMDLPREGVRANLKQVSTLVFGKSSGEEEAGHNLPNSNLLLYIFFNFLCVLKMSIFHFSCIFSLSMFCFTFLICSQKRKWFISYCSNIFELFHFFIFLILFDVSSLFNFVFLFCFRIREFSMFFFRFFSSDRASAGPPLENVALCFSFSHPKFNVFSSLWVFWLNLGGFFGCVFEAQGSHHALLEFCGPTTQIQREDLQQPLPPSATALQVPPF